MLYKFCICSQRVLTYVVSAAPYIFKRNILVTKIMPYIEKKNHYAIYFLSVLPRKQVLHFVVKKNKKEFYRRVHQVNTFYNPNWVDSVQKQPVFSYLEISKNMAFVIFHLFGGFCWMKLFFMRERAPLFWGDEHPCFHTNVSTS